MVKAADEGREWSARNEEAGEAESGAGAGGREKREDEKGELNGSASGGREEGKAAKAAAEESEDQLGAEEAEEEGRSSWPVKLLRDTWKSDPSEYGGGRGLVTPAPLNVKSGTHAVGREAAVSAGAARPKLVKGGAKSGSKAGNGLGFEPEIGGARTTRRNCSSNSAYIIRSRSKVLSAN